MNGLTQNKGELDALDAQVKVYGFEKWCSEAIDAINSIIKTNL